MNETPPRHAIAEQAVTILMAVVPCGSDTARRILGDTARAAGAGLHETARVVLALGRGGKPATPLGRALTDAMDEARSAAEPVTRPYTRLLPDPRTIGELLKRHRGLRRRALAAPEDPAVRVELDDATYALCVLMGRRNAHTALRSAELLLGAARLGTTVIATAEACAGAPGFSSRTRPAEARAVSEMPPAKARRTAPVVPGAHGVLDPQDGLDGAPRRSNPP
ncbi:DUF5133 domain-containing protein [Streptomyces sp. NRRL F-2747]|uniref:DUF5133 domain-containing protein n=1 Tax=Streptomyces sp. NRRL F-2747 TaxID=1463843 RepID=UPI00068E4EB5|nr:DUF5133 domain-containing protein [Streptomyces sp. NRRL F-2747]